MSAPADLERRLAGLVLAGQVFSADDLTDDGSVALDAGHTPNGRQNGIGALIRSAAGRHLLEWTGGVVRSRAPHRKGGMQRLWRGTDAGRLWARSVLDDEGR